MPTEFFVVAIVILIAFAAFDLMVGVSNDAVNFLNSAIGSKVAPIHIIMFIASLGILAGVTFSGGMMEVARKGIFHPQFFTMPEMLTIFLAVMLTDIILLDLFNTFGLPTSTTVSIVFELLGGAVAVSVLKIVSESGSISSLGEYINTAKAMMIIFGILLSVIVAFTFGAIIQFFTRLFFSFDYVPRLKYLGGLWGGVAMSSIFYFILVKGSKGATFLTPETADYIKNNSWSIIFWAFALAMAFAANDLVNFIGVPLAGLASYNAAMVSDSPLTLSMGVLAKKVPTDTYLLLFAGGIMVATLWLSKKSRTVTQTELSLGQQDEGTERFESIWVARVMVRIWLNMLDTIKPFIPQLIRNGISKRMDPKNAPLKSEDGTSFDLMRASVNLMVASGCISYATSQKLPLSMYFMGFPDNGQNSNHKNRNSKHFCYKNQRSNKSAESKS